MKFRPYLSLLVLATLVVGVLSALGLYHVARFSFVFWVLAYMLVQSILATFVAIRALAK